MTTPWSEKVHGLNRSSLDGELRIGLLPSLRGLNTAARPAQCPFRLTLSLQRIAMCSHTCLWDIGAGTVLVIHSSFMLNFSMKYSYKYITVIYLFWDSSSLLFYWLLWKKEVLNGYVPGEVSPKIGTSALSQYRENINSCSPWYQQFPFWTFYCIRRALGIPCDVTSAVATSSALRA